jgi:hypothetical protein
VTAVTDEILTAAEPVDEAVAIPNRIKAARDRLADYGEDCGRNRRVDWHYWAKTLAGVLESMAGVAEAAHADRVRLAAELETERAANVELAKLLDPEQAKAITEGNETP